MAALFLLLVAMSWKRSYLFFFPHLLFSHFPLNYDLMSEFSLEKRFVSVVNSGYRGDSDFLICHVTSRDHFLN